MIIYQIKPGSPDYRDTIGEKEALGLSEPITDELKQKILKYLGTVDKARNRDVARAISAEKDLVDKAIGDLAKTDQIEYRSFGGITYIVLKGK